MEQTVENPLLRPSAHNLVTLLKELKFGRKAEQQQLIQEWIDSFNYDFFEVTVEEVQNGEYCPIALSAITELSKVKNITWYEDDNQNTVSVTINFKQD